MNAINETKSNPIQVETFSSIPVNQLLKFDLHLLKQFKPSELIVTISNSAIGNIDKQLEWTQTINSPSNKCQVSFLAPIVGLYTINLELPNQPLYGVQFQAKAYDLSKVFINDNSTSCYLNESYEFSVDASEAGEGQLEIAVNEGEIPNQVQVLDNGKCIVNFEPEDCVPHVVDIKFNGHNVIGCPFVVDVKSRDLHNNTQQSTSQITGKPTLVKEERILLETRAAFSIENLKLTNFAQEDLSILDPDLQPISYKLIEDVKTAKYTFEFWPSVVGDYTVELGAESELSKQLPSEILEQFPFPLKVFDFNKVQVSQVTDGVVGHPIYFFIDASQAGSGNLEIRVSSKTRNVPNYPQSEANAKIRVNFIPTEAVDHSIDVKFNGISVPGNPFLVRVAQFPQARLPVTSQDALKYVPINETVNFSVDYIGNKDNKNLPVEQLTSESCQVFVLRPDFAYSKLTNIELKQADKNEKQVRFVVGFKPTKIGPYKLFVIVNNELLPSSPVVSNVFNTAEVKVLFDSVEGKESKPVGVMNKPVTFTVDASKAGEGTLALAVVSGLSRNPVQTDVKVSDKGHGLYNLTFVPSEFAPHSIDMSFNEQIVPNSPFVVDILDENGKSSSSSVTQKLELEQREETSNGIANKQVENDSAAPEESNQHHQMVQNFEALNLKQHSPVKQSSPVKSSGKLAKAGSLTTRKSLAFGLINASNIVHLESGVLDNSKNRVTISGPNNEKVPFEIRKGSSEVGEPEKLFIEYKPKSIGKCKSLLFTANELNILSR